MIAKIAQVDERALLIAFDGARGDERPQPFRTLLPMPLKW